MRADDIQDIVALLVAAQNLLFRREPGAGLTTLDEIEDQLEKRRPRRARGAPSSPDDRRRMVAIERAMVRDALDQANDSVRDMRRAQHVVAEILLEVTARLCARNGLEEVASDYKPPSPD